jgi:integrase
MFGGSRRNPALRPPDGLMTKREAAARLACSEKTPAEIRHHGPRHEAPAPDVRPRRPQRVHLQPNPKGRPVSVRRDPRSPFYQYNFQIRGHRFYGSTKCTTRREAEAVEADERRRAKERIEQARHAATSLRLDDVAGRYWQEVGQHHAGADNTERLIGLLIQYFGKDKLITEIIDDDVARLVAWRRGHRVVRSKRAKAEDDTTEQLKKLFTRAKLWGVRFDHEPQWRRHWLAEPEERVRELVGDEGDRLEAATRDDYAPFFAFLAAVGLRWNREARVLRWSEVDWSTRQITMLGKHDKRVTVPITPTIREILWPLQGHHPEFVFTYVAQRTMDKVIKGCRQCLVKGKRYPLTKEGTKTAWRRLRKRAGVTGFRTHDYRHDLGTKVLRKTGNLKLVQRMLNHASIKTTAKYAHVLTEEVADAMESVAELRKKPRKPLREVG